MARMIAFSDDFGRAGRSPRRATGLAPAALPGPPARRRLRASLTCTLADLHAMSVTTPPLSTLGKPAGFVERQVRGWPERWHRSNTTLLPERDAPAAWRGGTLPQNSD